MSLTLAFSGGGVMARALIQGIISGGGNQHTILVFDPDVNSTREATKLGATAVKSNGEMAKQADIVFICTKPQYVASVCKEMSTVLDPKKTLVVSVAAGVACATIEAALPRGTRVVRVMPNTPCVVQRLAAGLCRGTTATKEDADIVMKLLTPMGCVVQVTEDQMHAVTGLSGSGPAYIFIVMEALADGGVRAGLPRDVALQLAIHTVRGAAEMCAVTGTHPAVLKDQVASPGGTTIAAIAALEDQGVRNAFIKAVTAASTRSRELSKL